MRDVAVTEGDKVEAQIRLGWTVDYYGIGDLVAEIASVGDDAVEAEYQKLKQEFVLRPGDNDPAKFERSVRVQLKQYLGIRSFLEKGGYTAFCTNFEDLWGLEQLPGLASQLLMRDGYGFGAEGDWKTAALTRLLKIMGFSQIGAESEWRTANTESIKQAAKDAGVNLQFSDAQQKQENQIKAIRSFIAQGVDIIAFVPIVETGWDTVLKEAKDAKIPVIVVDRDVKVSDDSLYVAKIGTDSVAEGKKVFEWIDQYMRPQVFLNLFIDNAALIIVTVGITFTLLIAGIDLSVGAVLALCCMFSTNTARTNKLR